ncbi:putative virulence factor [Yersinia bercovieri]|uniref:virulence factor SrfB n=1 Tax=Yersinia bercovieri TaxID=634 RepID=UPI00061C900E|nr:virulence factor SrfB [Yersinia bercovieri]CNF27169.1 putative virulence factor [Yersinia bercovieri]
MLINLIDYPSSVTLVKNSGIQFLDFGITPVMDNPHSGRFVRQSVNGPLLRLSYETQSGKFTLPGENGSEPEILKPESTISLEDSLRVLDSLWLPLPFMRFSSARSLSSSPENWARVHIKRLQKPDPAGNTLRICIAFDTKVHAEDDASAQLMPTRADVRNGTRFVLAWHNNEINEFLDQTWVDGWLREVFVHYYATRQDENGERDINSAMKAFEYQAHFLNILEMLGTQVAVPDVQIVTQTLNSPMVPVDLILDVGNSHTCGVLLEDHGEKNAGLQQSSELHIRSLGDPQLISAPLFTSRLEFNEAKFGKHHFSMESGREDAFIWPSIVRVGDEAGRLAMQRKGTDGISGISSPRRYLWDDMPAPQAWRFSQFSGKKQSEPRAIALPLMNLMNDDGQPLHSLPPEERLPVFSSNYSRSSLMTMMLCEVITQALVQINSVSHRQNMGLIHAPRSLRSLILTLPSAMPKQEREIFRLRVKEATQLVWKALGWQSDEEGIDTLPLPEVHMEWDEATCGQLVWLYNETMNNYAGHARTLFQSLARPERLTPPNTAFGSTLRVASIDIGGGTTDMAITQYQLDDGIGSNIKITPRLLFREGFKIAGDDLLLDVIQYCVLPALQQVLLDAGIADVESIMAKLFGDVDLDDNRATLRQQTTLQLFIPLGHAILASWEKSDPLDPYAQLEGTFGELLSQPPTANVINYIHQLIQPLLPVEALPFDVLNTPLQIALANLKEALLTGRFSLTAPLQSLGEIIRHYCCDVLLVTGHPACLPGVQALLRYLQPVPISRIVWLGGYPIHRQFPFGRHGCVANPKSTAALGAMLYRLAIDLRLPGFNFKAADIQAYSTIRYLGVLDGSHNLHEENVWYADIDLDNPDAHLDSQLCFPLRGDTYLGFRQLADAHWPATPLYILKITTPELAKRIAGDGVLYVRLQYDPHSADFSLVEAKMQDGSPVPLTALKLKLNTLANSYSGANHYWIDSGSVYSK